MNKPVLLLATAALFAFASAEIKCKETKSPSPSRGGVYRVPYGAVQNVTVSSEKQPSDCSDGKFGICIGRACVFAKRNCRATFKYCYDPSLHCKYKLLTGAIYKFKSTPVLRVFVFRGMKITRKYYRRRLVRMPGKKDENLELKAYRGVRIAMGKNRRHRLVFKRKNLYPSSVQIVGGESKCVKGKSYKLVKNGSKTTLFVSKDCLEKPVYFNICFNYVGQGDIKLE